MSTAINILGQVVPGDHPDALAIGMYFPDPATAPVDCGALRPVMVVAHHGVDSDGKPTGVLYGCNGTTETVHDPDVYLVDDPWKGYLIYVMIIAVIILGIAIIRKVL